MENLSFDFTSMNKFLFACFPNDSYVVYNRAQVIREGNKNPAASHVSHIPVPFQ